MVAKALVSPVGVDGRAEEFFELVAVDDFDFFSDHGEGGAALT